MKKLLNMVFGRRNIVFALNIYLATVLALFVAISMDLPNPWWAMLKVVLTSRPLSGSVWARAIYRVIGTVVGVAVIVILVPPRSSTSQLLTGAIAVWTAACLNVLQLDRTARSYGFMLSGYTVALIVLPLATNPSSSAVLPFWASTTVVTLRAQPHPWQLSDRRLIVDDEDLDRDRVHAAVPRALTAAMIGRLIVSTAPLRSARIRCPMKADYLSPRTSLIKWRNAMLSKSESAVLQREPRSAV
jgi:hypothetical protein